MSIAIYMQPVKGKRIGSGSTLAGKLRLPHVFTQADRAWLEGFAAAGSEEDKRVVEEIVDAIDQHEEVRVWGES